MKQAPLRVLVACEFSGTVRNAFLKYGHDAWSCDLLPSEDGSNRHIVGDARDLLNDGWDLLMVAHPPCTRLCNSGVRWLTSPPKGKTLEDMRAELEVGAALFSDFWNAPIERIAIENPIMHKHAKALIRGYELPAQIVQPWWFGDPFFKATGLYLKNLKKLEPTNRLTPPDKGTAEYKQWERVFRMPPGPNRAKERSRFFPGIADAMAALWGGQVLEEGFAA
ncbi:putative phage protein Gp12 [Roseibium sp. TrichSKD4]|uniref:hypothetical protein n=1 Tax=Roseibium sp. TrichSKD4 TaxID=744980 RepID=UPI0001E56398|nr:hypothetical protein [Roseibium sp. TrichSKD4]EFO33922.1 putative phage protein Gp12 [Roseibium sp. TrichSKD4]